MKRRLYKYFTRFLISYLLVLFIPLAVTIYFNYNYLFKSLDEYIFKDTRMLFEQTVENINREYSQLFSISNQIQNNTFLAEMGDEPGYSEVIKAKNIFSNYVLTNNFIDEIFYFDSSKERIISSHTFVSFDFFFTKLYTVNDMNPENIRNLFMNIGTSRYLHFDSVVKGYEDKKSYGAFIVNARMLGRTGPPLLLGFLLNEDTLVELLHNSKKESARYYIFSRQGTIIYSNDDGWKDIYPHLMEYKEGENKGEMIHIGGEEFFILYEFSRTTGMNHFLLIPREVYLEEIRANKWSFILSLLVCLIISSIIIVLLTLYNYKPIGKLLNLIPKGYSQDSRDEFSILEYTIRTISEDKVELEHKLESHKAALVQRNVSLLLNNEISDEKELFRFFGDNGIPLDCRFQVVIARPDLLRDNSVQSLDIADMIGETLPSSLTVFSMKSVAKGYYILLILHPPGTGGTGEIGIKEGITRFIARADEEKGHIFTAGIGKIYDHYSQAAKSYLEANTCLEYSIIKGHGLAIDSKDIEKSTQPVDYPHELLKLYQSGLEEKDQGKISHSLVQLKAFLISGNIPVYLVRMISYDILSHMQQRFMSLNIALPEKRDLFRNVESLANLNSIDIFFEDLEQLHGKFFQMNPAPVNSRDRRILEFIKENSCDAGMSSVMVADHFHLSRSNFSRMFKENAGISFTDYLSKLRLERSRELLKHTDKSINEIVREIGYSDTSAFIKKFKKTYGMTPLQFRKNR